MWVCEHVLCEAGCGMGLGRVYKMSFSSIFVYKTMMCSGCQMGTGDCIGIEQCFERWNCVMIIWVYVIWMGVYTCEKLGLYEHGATGEHEGKWGRQYTKEQGIQEEDVACRCG